MRLPRWHRGGDAMAYGKIVYWFWHAMRCGGAGGAGGGGDGYIGVGALRCLERNLVRVKGSVTCCSV